MNSCVCADTPGVIRSSTFGIGPNCSAASASRRSSSSNESTMMCRTPAAIASRSSVIDLLLPCNVHTLAGTPAASTTASSPPDATSSREPLVVHEPSHGFAQERLGGVHDLLVTERSNRLLATSPKMRFVVHEHRRAVLRCDLRDRAAADAQVSVGADRRVIRQQLHRNRAHRRSPLVRAT